MPDYDHFLIGDFVRDSFFQQWVVQPEEKHLIFWEQWLAEHPHRQETVAQAREIIQTLGLRPDTADNADFIAVWEAVHQNMQAGAADRTPVVRPQKKNHRLRWAAAAASLIGVTLLSFFYVTWLAGPSRVIYTTNYGETKEVTLPDRSRVTLNANSTLSFADDWLDADPDGRIVRLEGEAFFRVTKQRSPDGQPIKFTVQAEDLVIAVVGTQFNVSQRDEAVKVMLTEGRVQLHNPANTVNVTMTPGELVEYSAQTNRLSQTRVNPEVHTAWRDHRYVFEDTSLEEIKALIEHNYGREVRLETASLRDRKITATIPSTELAVLLTILEETLAINITEEDEHIIFRSK